MKEARVTKLSRHHNRANKLKKAEIKAAPIDRNDIDIAIIDIVLKALYYNSHIDTLNVETDIYKNANIKIPYVESERLWEVMINSGLVNPVAGFGNAGKLKLSRTGYQLMAQFGGYKEYMEAMKNSNAQGTVPQIIIETPGAEEEEDNDCKELTDEKK
ncbi:MAG: hypothetical protein KDC07_07270 [Chitinophagaceae bacterium]|nr:hypothetical protein [Chitinophagaceae bacterium]MCB9046501.1 hypothetical protein [Chitinophagales bacterium]